jgi:crotonobetainyl-CoA:carnitine CoA-transferase CaiB-like acyl-CoA transferase
VLGRSPTIDANDPRQGALSGVRVVEWGTNVTAPYAAKLLADMGADVVKVEELPHGDPSRRLAPFARDATDDIEGSALYQYLNAGKRGIALDLSRAEDLHMLHRLTAWTDIFIHDQPTARTSALAMGFDDVARRNKRVAVLSLTPFGLTGPYHEWRACNMVLSHLAGLGKVTHWAGLDPETVPPQRPAGYFVDFTAGTVGAVAALAALDARDVQGRAQLADVSAWEAAVLATFPNMLYPPYEGRGLNFRRPHLTARAPMGYMKCKDGFFWAAVLQPRHWEAFTELLGVPELAREPLFSTPLLRGQFWDVLEPILNAKIADRTKEELFHAFQTQGIPIVPAFTIQEALGSDHLRAREVLAHVEHPTLGRLSMPRNPCRLGDAMPITRAAPRLGEHNGGVARELAEPHTTGVSATDDPTELSSRLPLDGVRVLDLSWVLAGPLATQILSHLGAEVIKVESDRIPDIARTNPPFANRREDAEGSGFFASLSAGKRTVTIDLATPEGLAIAKDLVKWSDLVVENFSPGTLDRLGLGYDELRKVKPDTILLSISGVGQTGPWSRYRFFGLQIFALSGISTLTSPPGAPPAVTRAGGADPLGAIYAALAALAALRHRRATGRGQQIDISMLEATLAHLPDAVLDVTLHGRAPVWVGNRESGFAPVDCFRCRGEDAWVAIAVHDDAEWAGLCRAIGRPELASDARFIDARSRRSNEADLRNILTNWTSQHAPDEAMRLLQARGVPAGASFDVREVLADPHFIERGFMEEIDHRASGRRRVAGVPWKITGVPPVTALRRVPRRNEDAHYVLHDILRLSVEDVADLTAKGVVPPMSIARELERVQ